MQTLDINNPGLPDLQFVLLVVALTTSNIPTLNVPDSIRQLVFDRCWALIHDTPPPAETEKRVLELREGDEVTLEAMLEVIRRTLTDHGISQLTWDHLPSEPTRPTTPEAWPLVERLQKLYPPKPDPPESPSGEAGSSSSMSGGS